MFDTKLHQLLFKAEEITIVGYYGASNFGDDLMLVNLLKKLDSYSLKINIIAHNKIDWLNKVQNIGYWQDGQKKKNFNMFNRIVKNSDLIIWGGGTCFTDEEGDGLFKYMMYAKFIKRIKFGYISVGIGNIRKIKSKLKTMLLINFASYVSLREENSFAKAKKYAPRSTKLELTEDLAIGLINEEEYKTVNDQNQLLISWRNLDLYKDKKLRTEDIVNWIMAFQERAEFDRIVIIDADSTVDFKISDSIRKKLRDMLPNKSVVHYQNISFSEKMIFIQESKYVLTSRLHVAISASLMEKECYAYNYSPKIEYYYKTSANKSFFLLDKYDFR